MYAYVKGRLTDADGENVIVEAGGIGYNIRCLQKAYRVFLLSGVR